MVVHLIKVSLAAVMLFCAILVWARTRDTTWVLMVFTALFWYVQILLDFLEAISVISVLPLPAQITIHALPLVTFSLAFVKFRNSRKLL